MQRSGHRGFRFARIDDDDLRLMRIAADSLPKDRMSDAQIRTDEDDNVGLLQIVVRVRRRVETKGLLVSDDRSGHA